MPNIVQLNDISNGYIGTNTDNNTSSTTITLLGSFEINPNTYTTNDYVSFGALFSNNSTVSGCNFYLYINSANTLTNAIQLGKYSASTSDGLVYLNRRILIKNSTGGGTGVNQGTQVITNSLSSISDFTSSTTIPLSIDWTKAVNFIAAASTNNVSDLAWFYGFKVFKY